MQCRIKILKPLEGVYTSLQPVVGAVYDAEYYPPLISKHGIAVITINNKFVVVRHGEYIEVK